MAKKKTVEITKDAIVALYTDYILTQGKKPNSVYEFAKNNQIEESSFYKFYSSFDALEEHYFSDMCHYTIELLTTSSEYENYDVAQKLSGFYFTFFELSTANRSFVLHILQHEKLKFKNVMKLKLLRKDFLTYVKNILDTPYAIGNPKIDKIQNRFLHEGAWWQFMSIIKYWMEDSSVNFENTDIYIEKSIKAGFEIAYNFPLESVLDFGKFIWKEKFGNFESK